MTAGRATGSNPCAVRGGEHVRRKKVWLAAGLLVVVAVTFGIVTLVRSFCRQKSMVNEFFTAVCAADGDRVRGMMVPQAAGTFDDPLLASFAAGLREYLGEFKGISPKHYQSIKKIGDSDAPTKISCILDFEKGSGRAAIEIVDGKVASFKLASERIPNGWSPLPTDTQFWREQGREFLTAYVEGDAEKAYSMMHPNLQKKAPLERLRKDTALARREAGKLLAVQFVSEEKAHPSGKAIRIRYRLKCEKLTRDMVLSFEFAGLKGYLTGVAPATEEASAPDR